MGKVINVYPWNSYHVEFSIPVDDDFPPELIERVVDEEIEIRYPRDFAYEARLEDEITYIKEEYFDVIKTTKTKYDREIDFWERFLSNYYTDSGDTGNNDEWVAGFIEYRKSDEYIVDMIWKLTAQESLEIKQNRIKINTVHRVVDYAESRLLHLERLRENELKVVYLNKDNQ